MRLSVKEIKERAKSVTTLKYVRVGDDFRFATTEGYLNHSDLVAIGEKATSAGFFHYIDGQVHLQKSAVSMSLGGLGPICPEDQNLLEEILNV